MSRNTTNPLLTVAEVYKDLKKCGVRWGPPKIRQMIREGHFPGIVKGTRCEIPVKKYEQFKEDNGFVYLDDTVPADPADDEYTRAVMEFEATMNHT